MAHVPGDMSASVIYRGVRVAIQVKDAEGYDGQVFVELRIQGSPRRGIDEVAYEAIVPVPERGS